MQRISALGAALLVILVAAVFASACEEPDASYLTSPSVKALIGTTTGNVAFNAPETAPPAKDAPSGWSVSLDLASFQNLENGRPALDVVLEVQSKEGSAMELWLVNQTTKTTAARWSAGATSFYDGVVCFQLDMEDYGEAVPLTPGTYQLTVAFRDPDSGVVVARQSRVTSDTPVLHGAAPAPNSKLFQEALACKRGG